MINSNDCGARLRQTDTDYVQGEGIGAAGHRTWTFETPSDEENYIRGLACDVKFYYQRSWEDNTNAQPDHTVRVTIGQRN